MEIVDVKQRHERPGQGPVYGWHTIRASSAIRLADPRLRCPECYGAVGLYGASENRRMPERAEHRTANPGCSLGDCFSGTREQAKLPIEAEQESSRDRE